MHLHCLGTAGYHPSETRHTSCYFLPESGIVLDAGTGIFRLPPLIRTDNLDILLSHAHLDHVAGLTFLFDILLQRPVQTVRVWGEKQKLDAIAEHLTSEFLFPVPLPVTWHAIDDDEVLMINGAFVTFRTQEHPGGSVAYRIENDSKSLVYATDTAGATDPDTLKWMSGADVLLHECNFKDDQIDWAEKTGHCYLQRVADVCAAAKPKRVLLTHVNPIDELVLDEDESRFAMPCEVAEDHLCIEF